MEERSGTGPSRPLPRWRVEFLEKLVRELDLGGKVVLEAGCGDGALTRLVAERTGAELVVGVDPCASWTEGPNHVTVPMNLQDLEFPGGWFDAVFSHNVLEHVHGLDAAWAELKRVLKPGAAVFADFAPLWSHAFGHHWYDERDDGRIACPVPPYGHLFLSRKELLAIVRRSTRPLSVERGSAKDCLLGDTCNGLFPADYRRIFLADPDLRVTEWREIRESHHDRPVPAAVLARYPQVPPEDFGVCGVALRGTTTGGRAGLAPGLAHRASRPSRPGLLPRLLRRPRKLWNRL